MNREEKARELEQLKDRLGRAKALLFSGYRGLKVSEMTELRRKLRGGESFLQVVKNRLVTKALTEQGLKPDAAFIDGPTAVAWSESDPSVVAKALVDFAKDHEAFVVRGGFFEGRVYTLKEVETLASLPSRDVLLARAMGAMKAPLSRLAGVLAAIPQKLVRVLAAVRDTKKDVST